MRMRLAPSRQQVCVDSLVFSEELYAAKLAVSDAFFDFATQVGELIPTLETMTVKALIDRCVELGITFHAQKSMKTPPEPCIMYTRT